MKNKKQIMKWLLKHAVNDWGDMDLTDLDFSGFEGNIHLSRMKVKNDLYQYGHVIGGMLYQEEQKVGLTLLQCNQTVGVNLNQSNQKVKRLLFQSKQQAGSGIIQDNQKDEEE